MKQKLFTLFAAVIIAANAMAQTTQEGHEYVDLGLTSGTLWATYNVGATSPEEYGDYFAWGETSPKKDSDGNYTEYSWSTYKYCNGSSSTLTKYCTDSSKGTVDNKTTLDPEDDAATANWGGDWRMPTKVEQDELCTECNWDWTDDYNNTGKAGYIVTSKAEGNTNSIFLPAAGYRHNWSLISERSYGLYWSSSLNEGSPYYAYYLYFYSGYQYTDYYYRYCGRSVRPVQSPKYTITASANDAAYGTVTGGGTFAKGKTITLTAIPDEGYAFSQWSDGNTENPRTVTVTQDSTFTVEFTVVHVTGISLDATLELSVGDSEQLKATFEPTNALNKNITWITTNANVATVENGLVKGISAGAAAILAQTEEGGYLAWCNVQVTNGVSGISLDKTSLELTVGNVEQLSETITAAEATYKAVNWTTSDASVATVENGLVTAVGAGVAAIGVATVDGGFVATCAVTVKAAGPTTEVQQVASNPSGIQKVLVDGVIYIVKPNGETYTVDGRKVE